MARTPDRRDGPLHEEEVQFETQAADPTLDGAMRYTAAGAFRMKDNAGVFNPRDGASLFGNEWQEVEDPVESASSVATLQEKLLLTTTALPLGDYIVKTSMQVRATQASTQIQVVAILDGSIQLGIANLKAGVVDATFSLSPWGVITQVSGVHTISLQWAKTGGGGEAIISRARLALWRVL